MDREALGGLAVAIKEWAGAVVIISHNHEFVSTLCKLFSPRVQCPLIFYTGPEIWNVDNGHMTQQGKTAVVEDMLEKGKGSGANTPARSRLQSPAVSQAGTPAVSGDENGEAKLVGKKKKKLTRNQVKAQEERRRLRKLRWLSDGGPKPEDTDDE